MCSFPTVDLAAALVVSGRGRRGTGEVRPLVITSAREVSSPAGWCDMGHPVALSRAVERAAQLSGDAFDRVVAFDLYSCFPTAVELARRAIGLADDDPRPLTVTGGLPYFGGPGASYSLHAIATMVERLRREPDHAGLVVGVGGMVDQFSVGIYGAGDEPLADEHLTPAGEAPVGMADVADGPAEVDAMTVLHAREQGPVAAPLVARLPDGRRVGARAHDPSLPADLAGRSLVGHRVVLSTVKGRVYYEPVT
jgi:acetyl-CoA C-acetyltransferase